MKTVQKIFRYQLWHLLVFSALLLLVYGVTDVSPDSVAGELWGVPTKIWLIIAVLVPGIHQFYVMLVWRIELYTRYITDLLGFRLAFAAYAIDFTLLLVSRMITVILLSMSNRGTLPLSSAFSTSLALLLLLPTGYLFYSVVRYFTLRRALGIDHFDPQFREPLVDRGIFRFTNNGMYLIGMLVLYIPALLLDSYAGVVAALFNQVYIWAHYFCTERPDMNRIYGNVP